MGHFYPQVHFRDGGAVIEGWFDLFKCSTPRQHRVRCSGIIAAWRKNKALSVSASLSISLADARSTSELMSK